MVYSMAIVKNNGQMSKYWLKAYSRAAHYLSNICITRWRAICPQGQELRPGQPPERLLYTHPDNYAQIQDFKKTSPTQKCLQPGTEPYPHLTKALP